MGPDVEDGVVLTALVRRLAAAWPTSVDPDDELDRALGFLDAPVGPATVVAASYTTGTAVGLVAVVWATLAPSPLDLAVAVPSIVVATVVTVGGPTAPRLVANARRTRALGAAPSLVTRAAIRMQLSPSPERAARFAAETADGRLADSLGDHARRNAAGPGTGLQAFAREWNHLFPALERACALLEEAASVRPSDRRDALDRARATVREASRDSVADFAAWIRGPATALYAFGVLLPLSLVAMLPALGAAGVPAPMPLIVATYDVVLPVGVLCASAWLLARRPVAFPPPAVDRSHPDVPSSPWRGPAVGLAGAASAWLTSALVLPAWTRPIAALGVGVGAGLVVAYRPATRVRGRVREVEDGLSDALALVGRRVEEGDAVEAALPAVGDTLPGATGAVFERAARRQRRLGVDVETAFRGPDGALSDVPSRRARSAAALLGLAATEGRPAGSAVAAMGDHLADLSAAERDARRAVEQVTNTLANTAAVFGPLVGGATVALAGAMGSGGPLTGGTDVPGLGLAIGAYVLVLAVLLTALATGLSRGFDRALVGYRVGLALLAATPTFLAGFVGTGLLV